MKDYRTVEKIISAINDSRWRFLSRLDNLLKSTLEQKEMFFFKKKPLRLNSIIQEIITIYQGIIQSKKIDFYIVCDENISLLADHNSLLLILENLIGNTLYILPDNGIIIIHAKSGVQRISIKIIHTWPDIDENKLKIVKQTTEISQPNVNETGFDMLLVNQLIKQNNGTISVVSVTGLGTTYTLTFPLGNIQ